jgi:A118 family predicted phage portal protein
VHVPIAADLAAMSAGMLFAASPEVTCEDEATQQRIDEIMQEAGVYSVLLRAAELASVFGGVFLKWTWDANDTIPRLMAVPADAGMPVFIGNRVTEIRFWIIVREDESHGAVWRLQETYLSNGHIISELYKGDVYNLGSVQPLNSIPETQGILPDANSGTDTMLAFYVPNILPNRSRPHLPFGRSDFEGLYGLFDALDEAYSAMQRETRMTKTTVIVPAEYLRKRESMFPADGKPSDWVYSNNTGAFTALDIDSDRASSPITVVNPEIRASARIEVCENLIRQILSLAGYAPQSAGLDIEGRAESGTALNVRERKSIRTSETKKTFWWHAINDIIRAMLRLDRKVFNSPINPEIEFSAELPANNQPDISQLAQIVEQLERAGAASIETKVDMLHPDWSDEQKEEEIERIRAEHSFAAQMELPGAVAQAEEEPVPPEGGDA